VSSKREKSFRVADLEKPGVATWDIQSLKLGKRPQEIPGRSLRCILEETVFSKREKSPWVAVLEESEAATWIYGA